MAKLTLKKVSLAIGTIGFALCLSTSAQTLKTPAEEARYLQYSQHEEVARFLSSLVFLSKEVTVQVIEKAKVYSEQNRVHLRMDYVRDKKKPSRLSSRKGISTWPAPSRRHT